MLDRLWQCLDEPKAEAVLRLRGQSDGRFVVHAATEPYFGELTMLVQGQPFSKPIVSSEHGVSLEDSRVTMSTLNALVYYYSSTVSPDLPLLLNTGAAPHTLAQDTVELSVHTDNQDKIILFSPSLPSIQHALRRWKK